LGSLSYDEGGALNEGIADYFAYYLTGREQVGEWGIGKFFGQSRPLNESNSLHISQVQTAGRLSYPQFILYDNSFPDEPYEGVHTAGMIASHYLVALTKEFKSQCSSLDSYSGWDLHTKANYYTLLLIIESLAEMGDLWGKGTDWLQSPSDEEYFTNFNPTNAFDWAQIVDPITYRKFFRTMAKNIKAYMTDGLCPEFTLDESEQLLDEYGLLLFKYYGIAGVGVDGNDNDLTYADIDGQTKKPGRTYNAQAEVTVNEANRNKSALVSKQFIDLPEDAADAYIFDKKSTIDSLLKFLTYKGQDVFITNDLANTDYNNNNLKISPGEVVAVSLNLFNDSNSDMAGIHVLASDWDHMYIADTTKNGLEPCSYDDFPSVSQGGILSTNSANPGDCEYTTRQAEPYEMVAGNYPADALAPVCMVEALESNETKWVSQGYFRKNVLNLEDDQCLNNSPADGSDMNPHECLIRFLPGANQAFYSKVESQKTWGETLQGANGGSVRLNPNGLLAMEVNKWIQPGTTFNCRVRVRFSNCSDCFNQDTWNREYPGYELAGNKPYKIINFKFTVID
jgi:hypothetical protein